MVPEILVILKQLTPVVAPEDIVEFCRRESFSSDKVTMSGSIVQ
jgi:hypothetical protein